MLLKIKYIVRVWLTTIVLSAVLVCLIDGLASFTEWNQAQTSVIMILLAISVGFVFSLPTVFLLTMLLQYFSNTNTPIRYTRLFLSAFAIVGVSVSFKILDERFFSSVKDSVWPLIYATMMAGSIWFYRISNKTE